MRIREMRRFLRNVNEDGWMRLENVSGLSLVEVVGEAEVDVDVEGVVLMIVGEEEIVGGVIVVEVDLEVVEESVFTFNIVVFC